MYMYRQACLLFLVLAIFVNFSHFGVFVSFWGLFVWLQLRSFGFGGHAQPGLGASASFCLVVVQSLFSGVCLVVHTATFEFFAG